MNINKKAKLSFPLVASCLWMFVGLPVYASDTGNAVQDILLSDRFNGAMSSIEWLTNIIDVWFIRVITITAFFIISSSILKNVAAGAVCAYPKFWRRVHEAHEKKALSGMLSKGFSTIKGLGKGGGIGGGGGAAGGGGGAGDIIFALIPDFMALTEFADTDMSPKQYWTKAIPEMIAATCIGVFIYNGLYRDTLATVSTAGANIISNILGSADPDSMTKFIFNNIKEPDNSFKNDPSIKGTWIRNISQEMYKKLNAKSTTFSTTEEGKQGLMGYCETYAQNLVNNYSDVFVANEAYYYNMSSVTVQILTVRPDDTPIDTSSNNLYWSHTVPITDIINSQYISGDTGLQPGDGSTLYLQVACNFSLAARDGKTIETSIQAIEGSLTTQGYSLPNTNVTVSCAGTGWVRADGGAGTAYVECNNSNTAAAIKQAIFNQCIANANPSEGTYGISGDSSFYIEGYGELGQHQCKNIPMAGNSATVTITVHYTYTPINSEGQAMAATSKSSAVTVTFTQ